jgi:glycosyltransferase involved in cell wall biosynthesis
MLKKIAIANVQVPFTRGGAEYHAQGLLKACRRAGYLSDLITLPFNFTHSVKDMVRQMEAWGDMDFTNLNGIDPDGVICLRFPAWYLRHPVKVAWILHQHRPAYDMWESDYPEPRAEEIALRDRIHAWDREALGRCLHLFANSKNVSRRLARYCGLASFPLYHPPPLAPDLFQAPAEGFVFAPSRLEPLKRQALLIKAAARLKHPPQIRISGTGIDKEALAQLIARHGLQHSVHLVGELSKSALLDHYARCSAVFFAPYDEDYGYVTLEAMLAAKPVITCTDSGGPLEFVRDRVTGWVCLPEPDAVASVLSQIQAGPGPCRRMGEQGQEAYQALGLSWNRVLQHLIQ